MEYVPLTILPLITPVIFSDGVNGSNIKVFKSADTVPIPFITVSVPVWYMINWPSLMSENNFPGLTKVSPLEIVASEIPSGKFLVSWTQVALKVGKLATPFCFKDFTSSILKTLVSLIVNGISIPETVICSPLIKVPEVWLIVKTDEDGSETA